MILPQLAELVALRGAARQLTLRAGVPARAACVGQHGSLQRGRGLELQEVRAYVPGDDPRSIDWRVTARRGRAHTKLFREERERPVWIVADLSPGLFFGTRRQLKSAALVRAAALLAWTAMLGGDRVGAVIGNGSAQRVLAARSREAGVLPLLGALIELQPRVPGQPAPQALNECLRLLGPLVRPGCLVLVLSDFAGLDAASEPLWWAIAARGECRLFRVTDPLEAQALPDGQFRAGLPDRLWVLDGAATRGRWRAAWQARDARIAALTTNGVQAVELSTARPIEETLAELLLSRRSAA